MRFILLGRGGLLSSIVLEELIANKLIPKLVIIEDIVTEYPNLMRKICDDRNIKYLLIKEINSTQLKEIICQINPDFAVVASLGTIIKKEILETTSFFNVHMGVLPHYKGAYTNFWKIKDGDDVFGTTIHEITEEIDSGRIVYIMEKDFSSVIHGFDFIRQNYFMAANALVYCIKNQLFTTPEKFITPIDQGKYYRKHKKEDFEIDFNKSCFQNYKIINRLKFYGNPFFEFNETKYDVIAVNLLSNSNYEKTFRIIDPNTILYYSETGILEFKVF